MKKNESQLNDIRDEVEGEKEKFIGERLGQLPIHQLTKQIKIDELLWGYDALSLCPSATFDKNSFYPSIETGYVYTIDMDDELVHKFNNDNFTKRSAILKMK